MDGLGESFLRRSRSGARSATGQDRLGEIVYWARSAGRDRAAATSDGEIGGFRWRDRLGEIKTELNWRNIRDNALVERTVILDEFVKSKNLS
ncbi:hypothetical protein SO802_000187 [Lithocarpus litseifolius]|uniref:Uncharacterized protein n=1 Tax=Lithocarpus litseifolius TaxID=425828 RepID=A0AAW2DUA7_9ROSI